MLNRKQMVAASLCWILMTSVLPGDYFLQDACWAEETVDTRGVPAAPEDDSRSLRIAAIVTTYFPTSHAGVIVEKFLRGFPTDDGLIPPRTEIASLYIDQIHERDIGRQIAKKYDVPLYESIRAALTLGGERLAVDAVLLIGEHGDYPRSRLGQEMLPRRYFFEQISGGGQCNCNKSMHSTPKFFSDLLINFSNVLKLYPSGIYGRNLCPVFVAT